MAEMYFPQLTSGALVQYPITKRRTVRTIRNVLSDGRLISYPDAGASTIKWSLNYRGLNAVDVATLKSLFDACQGPLLPFTFLDPTDNLLLWSSDLSRSVWKRSGLLSINGGVPGPNGQSTGFQIVNNGQATEEFSQTIDAPSNYQYSFCAYAKSLNSANLTLCIGGISSQITSVISLHGGNWTRVVCSGRLNDAGSKISVGLRLEPGQSVVLFGPQLEAQLTNSPYRPTANNGGVYPNCFWAINDMAISADEPNCYSTEFEIETAA